MIIIFDFFNFAHRAQCNSTNFYFGLPTKCSLSFRTAKKKGCLFHCWKGQPLALMVSLLLLRLRLCILGHPSHAGHRVRSSARLPLSISLFGPVRPCVPLKTTSSIGPISVGLALPKRKAGPFLRSAAAIPAGSLCAVLRGFGAYFSSPWAYPQQTAVRDSRSPCLSLSQPALFLGKRSIPCLWRCALCAASVFDSGRSLWAVPLQPPGRPSSRWGLRPCAFCARSSRRPGVLCRFRICGFCASKRIPISEFSLDLESRFADFRVLGPSRWLSVDGESVRTRFPPGSIASWRLCALVLCFCLCPPKFCASRFGKSRSMEKEFPSCFLFGFPGSSAASLPALRQRRRSFRYACVVQL